jgi:hypothetical protein
MRLRSIRRGKAIGAAALCLLAVAACGFGGSIDPGNPLPTLPGTPGHFDNGDFSFEYPAGWDILAGQYPEGMAVQVDAVLGTGSWQTGCRTTAYPSGGGGGSCTGDAFDVSGGRVVVKVWRRVGGPVDICGAAASANATIGTNAVMRSGPDSAAVWEIREPGGQFGWGDNVFIEGHPDGAAGLTAAERIVASFRWSASRTNGGCVPMNLPEAS